MSAALSTGRWVSAPRHIQGAALAARQLLTAHAAYASSALPIVCSALPLLDAAHLVTRWLLITRLLKVGCWNLHRCFGRCWRHC